MKRISHDSRLSLLCRLISPWCVLISVTLNGMMTVSAQSAPASPDAITAVEEVPSDQAVLDATHPEAISEGEADTRTGGATGSELQSEEILSAPTVKVLPSQDKSQGPGLAAFPPLEQFREITDRPLFSPSRRPDAKPGRVGSEKELQETWRLTGVVMVDDELQALFSERKGEQRLTLMVGMPLDDAWQLQQILPDEVVLQAGDLQVHLKLREPREPVPASPQGKSGPDGKGNDKASRNPNRAADTGNDNKGAVDKRSNVDTGK